MTEQEKSLWQRIQNFQLDDPEVAFKFSDRLARENGWSRDYTQRVIAEYKRFIFLCWVSPGGVTPSDPVDQAWHLHLTFTKSYWIDLCKNTLQQDIHHNPTKGGKHEAQKFDAYYSSSRQLYLEKFGSTSPADIWQDNHTRFSDTNFKRVNVGKFWIVRKPKFTVKTKVLLSLIIAGAFFIQASVATFMPMIIMGIVAILIIRGFKNDNNGNEGCGAGSGCGNSHNDGTHSHSDGHHGGDSGCSSGCSESGGSGCGGGSD